VCAPSLTLFTLRDGDTEIPPVLLDSEPGGAALYQPSLKRVYQEVKEKKRKRQEDKEDEEQH
jgi:hypothetical protein